MTVKEASAQWKMDVSKIGKLLRAAKIEGAARIGGHWLIPKTAAAPTDGRTLRAKDASRSAFFRFPFFMDQESYIPPLSAEESLLREAQLAFLACDFANAAQLCDSLLKSTESVYVRLSALFFRILLSVVGYEGDGFDTYFHRLNVALADDFSYKPEMELLRPLLYYYLASYKSAAESFHMEVGYDYADSATPLLTCLCLLHNAEIASCKAPRAGLEIFELDCRRLEQSGYAYEAQELHLALFVIYCLTSNEPAMLHHLRKALDIALQRNFLFPAANYAPYYEDIYDRVLTEYPADFAERIRRYGTLIHGRFAAFTELQKTTGYYAALSDKDYRYVLYLAQGYDDDHIAEMMDVTRRTVVNRFRTICEKLGIATREALLDLLTDSVQ